MPERYMLSRVIRAKLLTEGRPCRGGKSACPFEIFAVFVVLFFFSAPSRLATPTV
jgi:hypothetical protein